MQSRSLFALTSLIAAALAVPIISEKRELPLVGGLVPIAGGLPIVGGIIGGVGGVGGVLGGVNGVPGVKPATTNELPAASPAEEKKDLAKRKEAIGVPDLNTSPGSLTGALSGLSGLTGIVPRAEGV
ncbi:hypothetical protein BKA70DRAFT_1557098 [Coprinopsis sp. MPI-PUGE-AT-0042]|nr:hypothetical protein BKA70DRAFT_1557098 [Coprinopsis sp. MPI-PUGE-AT-0042]